jgi:uncharacterized protein
MDETTPQTYTAFDGHKRLAEGRLDAVVIAIKRKLKAAPASSILVFSDSTGKEMDFDLRGSEKEVLLRLHVYLSRESEPLAGNGPGRPKLGVVAREVSLLPRHWEWLSTQSGGASAALRKLVEEAKKSSFGKEEAKHAQERAHKFMTSVAGNLPRYEEALRALYARDKKRFKEQMTDWPPDVRNYSCKMADPSFETDETEK